jgi:hypothetical protein
MEAFTPMQKNVIKHALASLLKTYHYIIGSRSIWILGSSVVYWAGKEAVSRQGGRHLGLHNVGFQISNRMYFVLASDVQRPHFFDYVVMNTKTFSLCCDPYSERMWSKMSFYFR